MPKIISSDCTKLQLTLGVVAGIALSIAILGRQTYLGRFENFEILDWMVPRNVVFQKSAVGKFTFSLAGVRNFMDFLV